MIAVYMRNRILNVEKVKSAKAVIFPGYEHLY